ncbi:hypothetical protein D3C84_623140 [compost metagenome]
MRGEQAHRPTGDSPRDEVRVVRPGITYGNVGFAFGQAEDLRRGVQLHPHVGVTLMQSSDGRDQEVDGQRVGGGNPHGARQPIIEALDAALQFQRRMLHFLDGAHRCFTHRGQCITLGGAQEQRCAQRLFQRRDSPADRGLVDPQHPRSATQGRFAADRQEYPCVIPVHRLLLYDAFMHHCSVKSLHLRFKKAGYAGHQCKPTGHHPCPVQRIPPAHHAAPSGCPYSPVSVPAWSVSAWRVSPIHR